MLNKLQPVMKAVVAFIAPGVVALVQAVTDGSPGGTNVTGPEWVGIGAAMVLTSAAVYATPNRDPKGENQELSVQPPEFAEEI